MVRDKGFYWDLFVATLQLSAFTVGGGFVIVPLMRRKFIREKQWLDEDEMLDLTAIAQSAPGSIAINASILLGYRLAGFRGVLVTIFGTVLPPLFILSLVSMFYAAFKSNEYVVLAMEGMQAGVAAFPQAGHALDHFDWVICRRVLFRCECVCRDHGVRGCRGGRYAVRRTAAQNPSRENASIPAPA